jgi:hypothetical protein
MESRRTAAWHGLIAFALACLDVAREFGARWAHAQARTREATVQHVPAPRAPRIGYFAKVFG